MFVKQIMTPTVTSIEPEAPVQACANLMRNLNIGALPVAKDGQLLGIVTDRDLCCRVIADGRDLAKTTVDDVMSRAVTFCYDDQNCEDAAHLMEEHHVRRLPVMSRSQALVGFLSVDDLARISHELAGEVVEMSVPGFAH